VKHIDIRFYQADILFVKIEQMFCFIKGKIM